MNLKKTLSLTWVFISMLATASVTRAADYVIDGSDAGMHAAVSFRASHLGISALWGRFNDISGQFSYDKDNVEASALQVSINPGSIDTNHVARDEHLRSGDYLDVSAYPEAGFISTAFADLGNDEVRVTGNFTLHGVTKEISFVAKRTGEGETYFGDYRVGFEAELSLDVTEYGVPLAPDGNLTLILAIEGVRQ